MKRSEWVRRRRISWWCRHSAAMALKACCFLVTSTITIATLILIFFVLVQ